MNTITTIAHMQSLAESLRTGGKRIGFVPTMGFLHDGHLSLMRRAREENDSVVVSIFVNPTQFGPSEDLARYPRDADGDSRKCGSAGVDVLFMPAVKEMYPEKPDVFVTVEGVADGLEGPIRPGHFQGVATVVAKLFHIVKPHTAYFGQKDFQQCAVIKRMVKGLDMDVRISVLPTVREPDGLAMSSRNSYLSPSERQAATVLYRGLSEARKMYLSGTRTPAALREKVINIIKDEPGIRIDYVEIVDQDTLVRITTPVENMAILVAATVGNTRLLDNIVL